MLGHTRTHTPAGLELQGHGEKGLRSSTVTAVQIIPSNLERAE